MILIVQMYSYLCIMAASLTFLIEIFLQRWRVAPLSLQLLYRYDVRGNPDEMCVSACSVLDWCNPVLLTLLISLLTLSFNTSAAIFLPFSPLSQHYCTVCTSAQNEFLCLQYTLGFPVFLPKGFLSQQLKYLDTFEEIWCITELTLET